MRRTSVYLNTVIVNWEEFWKHKLTEVEFMDAKEKDLQNTTKKVKPGDEMLPRRELNS